MNGRMSKEGRAMRALIRPVVALAAALAIVAASIPSAAFARPAVTGQAGAPPPAARWAVPGRGVMPQAAPLSTISCAPCHLYAREGSLTLPGHPAVKMLGFATASGGAPRLPGPVIEATQGDVVTVTLHDELASSSEAVSLSFPGQQVTDNGLGTYSFVASRPGTYIYQAGLAPRGPRQVAMGLFGALVVRPAAAGVAYGAGSEYDREAIIVINGIDPAVSDAYPTAQDLGNFTPSYWLVNGSAYPGTGSIGVKGGDRLLVRIVNAGLQEESVGLLGIRQSIVATDGVPGPIADVTAQTIAPGATMDSIVRIPVTGLLGERFVLQSQSGHVYNGAPAGGTIPLGGFVQIIEIIEITDLEPPTVRDPAVQLLPSGTAVRLSASATDGASAITGGEWYVDTDPGPGFGKPMAAAASGPTTATLSAAVDIAGLTAGTHNLGVRARDAHGNWSAAATVSIRVARIVYKNGFDTGLGRWTVVNGPTRLAVVPAAALDGERGLRVSLSGTLAANVVDGSPRILQAYRARFLFHPRTAVTGPQAVTIFAGLDVRGRNPFRIEYRKLIGGAAQVRLLMLTSVGEVAGQWVAISNAGHLLELSWTGQAAGSLELLVDGTRQSSVTGDSRTSVLSRVVLGAVGGMSTSTSGQFDLDAFVSTAGPPVIE
jgi:hypothetical protein